jgi:pSer/pThr/pTyr-binding forkhead associated (FHA) protein
VPLGTGPFRIGRAPSNELALADDRASRTHAQIVRDGWDYVIEDLNSTNGILVNGAKVGRAVLSPGSQIGIGSTLLVFRGSVADVPTDVRR